jgi:hypothetical protein
MRGSVHPHRDAGAQFSATWARQTRP